MAEEYDLIRRKKRVNVRLTDEVFDRLYRISEASGYSPATGAARAISEWVREEERKQEILRQARGA